MACSTYVGTGLAVLWIWSQIFDKWWNTSSFRGYWSLHHGISWHYILGCARSHCNMFFEILWIINSFIGEGTALVSIENALLELWLGRHLQNVLKQLLLFVGCPTIHSYLACLRSTVDIIKNIWNVRLNNKLLLKVLEIYLARGLRLLLLLHIDIRIVDHQYLFLLLLGGYACTGHVVCANLFLHIRAPHLFKRGHGPQLFQVHNWLHLLLILFLFFEESFGLQCPQRSTS